MKLIRILLTGSIGSLLWVSAAFALEVKNYSAEALAAVQNQGKPAVLWFHATWCPTCMRQGKSFDNLKSDKSLDGVTVFVADYDTTEDLQRQVKVSRQSTMILYKGTAELARSVATTKEADIADFIKKAL